MIDDISNSTSIKQFTENVSANATCTCGCSCSCNCVCIYPVNYVLISDPGQSSADSYAWNLSGSSA